MFVIMFGYTSTSVAQPSKRLQIEGIDQRASEQEKQGERWGLFIGIEDYDDPRVTDLRYSIDDVQRITEILRDPARGAFEHLIPVPDLKATNSFSRISDSGDLLRISSRLIQIWYQGLNQ